MGRLSTAFAISGVGIALLSISPLAHCEWDMRGNVTGEVTQFTHEPAHTANQKSNLSLAAEVELYTDVSDSGSVTITPFIRVDESDKERSHLDFRELLYTHVSDTWEARVGLGKVFFGVAESTNLVDIINQFDSVEGFSSDAKLGQPMLNVLVTKDWGDIDLYLLPGFRERTFPGSNGRPRLPLAIDADNARFESGAENQHIDVAARLSKVVGEWDLAAHVFHGTAREPILQFNPNSQSLVPFYAQMTQAGIDAQATLESWLLKAELVYRSGDEFDNHTAAVTGFEYSFYDIKASGADLGIVAEYIFDERGEEGPALLQNDVLVALRFALNDAASTEALAGVITDLDGDGEVLSFEASRRFGSNLKASVTYTGWSDGDAPSNLTAFDREDNLRLELGYFF